MRQRDCATRCLPQFCRKAGWISVLAAASILVSSSARAAFHDSDQDGLDDTVEQRLSLLDNNPDTDGDGISDGVEVTRCSDPRNPNEALERSACSLFDSNGNFLLHWSNTGPIAGQHCTHVFEPNEEASWRDTYLCAPRYYGFVWSSSGLLENMSCVPWREGTDPYWSEGLQYLCLPQPQAAADLFLWPWNRPVSAICVSVANPREPLAHTWSDNSFCASDLRSLRVFTFECENCDQPESATEVKLRIEGRSITRGACVPAPELTIGATSIPVTGLPNFSSSATVAVPSSVLGNRSTAVTYSRCNESFQGQFLTPAPTISSVSPATNLPVAGGTTLTIVGQGLHWDDVTVAVGDHDCPVLERSYGSLKCVLPVGSGQHQPVVVRAGAGASSNVPTIDYSGGGSCAGHCGTAAAGCYCDPSCFEHGDCCDDANNACFKPTIVGITPATAPAAGGVAITITGSSLQTSADHPPTITVGGKLCPRLTSSSNTITCQLPAGQGAGLETVVTHDGVSSEPFPFSYLAPSLDAVDPVNGPTAGGTLITLTGNNFGTQSSVRIGNRVCSVTSQSDSTLECILPAGQGAGVGVVVSAGNQASQPLAFNYFAPTLDNITPTSGGVAGGTFITLTGSNFGVDSVVQVDGHECQIVLQEASIAVCATPPGSGADRPVILTAGNQSSNPRTFTYLGPKIDSISPNHGPVAGGTVLTISGSNFGTAPTASVGGINCPLSSPPSDTQVRCTVPQGEGINRAVLVNDGAVASNAEAFSYDPPVLSTIIPASSNTAGGSALTLIGNNFGTTSTVMVGERSCPVTVPGNTFMQCFLPAGEGTDLPVVVTASGQSSDGSVKFSYSAPVISGISPPTMNTNGGTVITLTGSNFGLAPTVTVQGGNCPVGMHSHSVVTCTAPAGHGTASVQLSVGGQSSNLFNHPYSGPYLDAIDPSTGPTAGGTTISLLGNGFGSSGGQVLIGGRSCSIIGQTDTSIQCQLPAGQGRDLDVTVIASGGQTSNKKSFTYNKPTITNLFPASGDTPGGTLITVIGSNFGNSGSLTIDGRVCAVTSYDNNMVRCLTPAGQGSDVPVELTVSQQVSNTVLFDYSPPTLASVSPADAPTSGNVSLTLTGTNFGPDNVVTVGGVDCPVTFNQPTSVHCNLPAGQGAGVDVVLRAGNQFSLPLPFSYHPPVLSAVSPAAGPTAGGITITLSGDNFGTQSQVTVNGNPCPVISQTHSSLQCSLPAGDGTNRDVQLVAGGQSSNRLSINYLPPTISSISPASAPTSGNVMITIYGSNFGLSNTVTVGDNRCDVSTQSRSRVACNLPPGSAGAQPVTLTTGGQSDTSSFLYLAPTATPSATPTATPTPLCGATPRSDCKAAGKSTLLIKDDGDDDRDSLTWKWTKGKATDVAELGSPTMATDYALCVYAGANADPYLEAVIAGGRTCAGAAPCWEATRGGFKFVDRDGGSDGIVHLTLKTGIAGKASVSLKGKGTHLPDVALSPALPVIVQLANEQGTCWSTTYSDPPRKSDATQFKAAYTAP